MESIMGGGCNEASIVRAGPTLRCATFGAANSCRKSLKMDFYFQKNIENNPYAVIQDLLAATGAPDWLRERIGCH
jgi:hypothetical protein